MKRNSLNRKEKSRDILRYTFRIAIRYKFLVYCDISIYRYIVTPLICTCISHCHPNHIACPREDHDWLVVLRIYDASTVFQPYRDLAAGDN